MSLTFLHNGHPEVILLCKKSFSKSNSRFFLGFPGSKSFSRFFRFSGHPVSIRRNCTLEIKKFKFLILLLDLVDFSPPKTAKCTSSPPNYPKWTFSPPIFEMHYFESFRGVINSFFNLKIVDICLKSKICD